MQDATPPRRRRWPLVVAAGLVVAIMFAAWQLRSEKLARTILDRAGPALGLELGFEGTPSYSLSPEPQLTLPNFHATAPGSSTPLLKAKRLMISLPWETIRGAEARTITRIELDEPVLHLGALAAWQETRPDEPFEVPTLTGGIEVADGTIVGDDWRLTGVDLALPRLAPGEAAQADVSGRFERGTLAVDFEGDVALARAGLASPIELDLAGTLATGDTPMPWTLRLAGELDASGDPITLVSPMAHFGGEIAGSDAEAGGDATAPMKWTLDSPLKLAIAEITTLDLADARFQGDGALPELLFAAHVAVADTLKIDAGGAIPRWPAGWPTLPPPLDASQPMSFVLGYDGAADLSAPLRLRLNRDGTRADVRAVLADVTAWMDRDDASPLPPITGFVETPALRVGAFTLDGVRVEFDDGETFADVESTVDSSETADDDDTRTDATPAAGSPRSP